MNNLTTELERELYVEIIGTKGGLDAYFDFAKDNNYEEYRTFKDAKIKLDLLNKLAEIIKKHTDEK